MRTRTFSALLLLAVLGGCGPAAPSARPGVAQSPAAGQWRDCTPSALREAGGAAVASVPADDGTAAEVRLVPPGGGPCSEGLVARAGSDVTGLDAGALDLEAGSARVVSLRGGAALLLVNGGRHPRGGFQPHLFSVVGGLHELLVDGNPLLPFVATDGGGTPVTATCRADGGIDVLTATTSEPPGVVLAWDVQRTSYAVHDGGVTRTGTRQVRDHTADPMLRKEMPALFEPDGFFSDCVEGPS